MSIEPFDKACIRITNSKYPRHFLGAEGRRRTTHTTATDSHTVPHASLILLKMMLEDVHLVLQDIN